MKDMPPINPKENAEIYKVHAVLAHSYIVYFIAFIFGMFFDIFFPISVFGITASFIGLALMLVAFCIMFWAQYTSSKMKKIRAKGNFDAVEIFKTGPYRFSRAPTHIGLFLLIFGYGLMMNSFIIAILSVVAYVVSKIVFIPEEEKSLLEKYGEAYKQYQSQVKF